MKTCSKCRREQELDSFYSDPRARDGKQSNCKSCFLERYRHHIAKPGVRERRNAYFKSIQTEPWRQEQHRESQRRRADKAREYRQRPDIKARTAAHRRLKRAENPQLHRAEVRNRKVQKKVGGGVAPHIVVSLKKSATRCPDCGEQFSRTKIKTLDHVVPLARGGIHKLENLRVICMSCNSIKNAGVFASNGQGMML